MTKAQRNAAQRRARAEEGAEIHDFFNGGPGSVIDTEGETVADDSAANADADSVTAALAAIPIRFGVTDEKLAELRGDAADVDFDTPEGYERGRKLLALLRSLSGAIERTRVIIKAPVLEKERTIDSTAKGLAAQVNEIRAPLQAKKDAVDNAKEIARRAAEEAEREAVRAAEQAKLAEQRAAIEAEQEANRLAAEAQRVEAERLEKERAELTAERQRFEAERAAAAPTPPAPPVELLHESPPCVSVAGPVAGAAELLTPVSEAPRGSDWVSPPAVADAALLAEFATRLRSIQSPKVTSIAAAAVLEQVESMIEEAAQACVSFSEEAATAAE